MSGIKRRDFVGGAAAAALLATGYGTRANQAAVKVRTIATEEAYAPQAYFEEFLKKAKRDDTMVTRYLKMYYEKPQVVKQLSNIEVRLADMDQHGIDMQLLGMTAPGVQVFDADLGTDLAAQTNDEISAIMRRYPGRFAGLAAVAPQSPQRAALEIERAMGQLGFSGIIINSHTNGEFLDHPKFEPILQAATQHQAPVYLHPTFPPDSMINAYSDYGMMGALWGFQAECSLHVTRMILSGVFDRYPGLTMVLGHMGEGLPYWLGRMDNRYQNILRRGGLAPLGMTRLKRLPSDYFRSNFYVTTSGMNWLPPLQYCLDLLGPDRVMFAIDYPFERTADATGFLKAAQENISAQAFAKIAHRNAESLFKLG
ncbi:amidohydrolase [Pseudomaricurvus alkylphenolicus]|uniref:amidohydrolase family protein n=1 Tax=Pseudomaricurvus alkylphenolicus TaxID=1306991 RepID=UPI00142481CF|nr:amidohydrolase family protein [Pseudomaricurvus alkylphenolicus]NIB43399.1 amidohydrolase [Pseudomaricurvus alkylphenolicus]